MIVKHTLTSFDVESADVKQVIYIYWKISEYFDRSQLAAIADRWGL